MIGILEISQKSQRLAQTGNFPRDPLRDRKFPYNGNFPILEISARGNSRILKNPQELKNFPILEISSIWKFPVYGNFQYVEISIT